MKLKSKIYGALVAGALLPHSAVGEYDPRIIIEAPYLTGNQFRKLEAPVQNAYAMGVVDGLKLSPILTVDPANLDWYNRCVKEMEPPQITALVKKYMDSNPGKWHYGMHLLVLSSLYEPCPHPE